MLISIALYPDSGFQSDSGLSQGGTDSGLHPHSCLYILTVFLAFLIIIHNTVHTLIFMLFSLAKGRNQRRNNVNDSFGKGFHELKDHVLNRIMTGRCPRKSLQLQPKFHSLFLQNSFDFQKSATFKALKLSPRMC